VQVSTASDIARASLAIRGATQTLRLYVPDHRSPERPVVIVISGDGGWRGLIHDVAQRLAAQGHWVIGVDAKSYLESLSKPTALEPAQVTKDFSQIARLAQGQAGIKKMVLVGWSEGAGLAVLAGLEPSLRADMGGVVAIGLPELSELAWRWSDATIYLTHKVPNEPTFNTKDYVGRLAPVPLVIIQSTHDEFVPLETARAIFAHAQEPKQLILIEAGGHHFDGQLPAFWQAIDRAFEWFESLAHQAQR
jgi:dienelactone hydrolase